jgi:NAD(P)-dependent dehydrogenase (short-subunit alcohol dehydrogenase family)
MLNIDITNHPNEKGPFSNKKILLTGGSGKLGSLMINALLDKGAEVIATYRTARNENELPVHPHLQWLQLDLLDESSRDAFAKQVVDHSIQIIVHNARSLNSLIVDQEGWASADHMQMEMSMAVTGPYDLTRRILKDHSIEQILFINSIYGLVAPNLTLYSEISAAPGTQYGTAKAAQLHLVKELAVRLTTKNIRVNALVLGGVVGRAPNSLVTQYRQQCPTGEMLGEIEVKNSLLMALQHDIKSLTGHIFVVDGGWTSW